MGVNFGYDEHSVIVYAVCHGKHYNLVWWFGYIVLCVSLASNTDVNESRNMVLKMLNLHKGVLKGRCAYATHNEQKKQRKPEHDDE
ncbi:hypothetical protein L1987_51791 [Smallanthus sonchifolius]|uniref:Uncharacterized protein n=1 Tax=Smallanthus sonchifolius TaxID=185202 RepID=A0ACB9ER91_9ASTR|nr:hypothetical protein L1987_51791 [Smallanthus sonchifolius]